MFGIPDYGTDYGTNIYDLPYLTSDFTEPLARPKASTSIVV